MFRCTLPRAAGGVIGWLIVVVLVSACATTPGRQESFGFIAGSAFSPDGKTIAVVTTESRVALFETSPLLFRRELTRETDRKRSPRGYDAMIDNMLRPRPIGFSPDGTVVAAGGVAGGVMAWDVSSGEERLRAQLDAGLVDLAFFPDGQTFVTAGAEVIYWSLTEGGRSGQLQLPSDTTATSVAATPDGQTLMVGLSNGNIAVFDAKERTLLRTLEAHAGPVSGIAFRSDGAAFASTAGGYDLRLWSREPTGEFEKSTSSMTAAVEAASKGDDIQVLGNLALLLSGVASARLGAVPMLPPGAPETESQFAMAARTSPHHCGSRVAISADGKIVASTANLLKCSTCIGTLDPAFLLFVTDLQSGVTHSMRINGCPVALSSDGRVAATMDAGAPHLWDVESGKTLERSIDHR